MCYADKTSDNMKKILAFSFLPRIARTSTSTTFIGHHIPVPESFIFRTRILAWGWSLDWCDSIVFGPSWGFTLGILNGSLQILCQQAHPEHQEALHDPVGIPIKVLPGNKSKRQQMLQGFPVPMMSKSFWLSSYLLVLTAIRDYRASQPTYCMKV